MGGAETEFAESLTRAGCLCGVGRSGFIPSRKFRDCAASAALGGRWSRYGVGFETWRRRCSTVAAFALEPCCRIPSAPTVGTTSTIWLAGSTGRSSSRHSADMSAARSTSSGTRRGWSCARPIPTAVTAAVAQRLEDSAEHLWREVLAQAGSDPLRHILTTVGNQPLGVAPGPLWSAPRQSSGYPAQVMLELAPASERSVPAEQLGRRRRELRRCCWNRARRPIS